MELPDELAELANDPLFKFELVFDHTGLAGAFIPTSKQLDKKYFFYVVTLPLTTESYTSRNNDIFYKNADIGQMILVFEKER